MNNSKIRPIAINLHQLSKLLEITFDDGETFKLPCEYLRVYSPSAEVRGHAPGQEVLQTGKEAVNIVAIEPVGEYAVRLVFDDSHNSGLYSWDYLYDLGKNRVEKWQEYLGRLDMDGYTRPVQSNDYLLIEDITS